MILVSTNSTNRINLSHCQDLAWLLLRRHWESKQLRHFYFVFLSIAPVCEKNVTEKMFGQRLERMAFCCFLWQMRLLLAVHNAAMSQQEEQCLLYGVVVSYSAQSIASRLGTARGRDRLRPCAVHSRPTEGHAESRSRRRLVKLTTQSRFVALRSP